MRAFRKIAGSGGSSLTETALLCVPLGIVLLAAGYAAFRQGYSIDAIVRFASGYPVRLDLEEVKEATRHRDTRQLLAQQAQDFEAQNPLLADTLGIDGDTAESLVNSITGQDGIDVPPRIVAQAGSSQKTGQAGIGPEGFLSLDFDLAGGPNSAGAIEVSKQVFFDKDVLGEVTIRIDAASSIHVSRADILRIVPSSFQRNLTLPPREFLEITWLRENGLRMRYDPIGDRLVLTE